MLIRKWYFLDKHIIFEKLLIKFSRKLELLILKNNNLEQLIPPAVAVIILMCVQPTGLHVQAKIGWHVVSCLYNFNKTSWFIKSRDWHMVTSQSLGNHWLDVFYWWKIWWTCRRGQQSNIFCMKKGPNNTATCSFSLSCWNVEFHRTWIKYRATGVQNTVNENKK